MTNCFIHPTAEVSKNSKIGENSKIWHQAQIREKTKIGKNCIIGKGVYIDTDVTIGNNVKIQNYALIYHTTVIENGVFIGPNVCFTNDKVPRAIDTHGLLKKDDGWQSGTITVKEGASIGAGSTILPDITIGKFAMIGAGSVITKDVPDFGLVYGNPAKLKGFVDKEGKILKKIK